MRKWMGLLLLFALSAWIPVAAGTVGVEWNYPPVNNADGFRLYYGDNPDPTTWDRTNNVLDLGLIGDTCDPATPDPVDPTLMYCTAFDGGQSPDVLPDWPRVYAVAVAYNEVGESADSEVVYKDFTPPGEPVDLRFTAAP